MFKLIKHSIMTTSGVLNRSGMSSFTSVVDSLLAKRHVFSNEWKDLSGRSKLPS